MTKKRYEINFVKTITVPVESTVYVETDKDLSKLSLEELISLIEDGDDSGYEEVLFDEQETVEYIAESIDWNEEGPCQG